MCIDFRRFERTVTAKDLSWGDYNYDSTSERLGISPMRYPEISIESATISWILHEAGARLWDNHYPEGGSDVIGWEVLQNCLQARAWGCVGKPPDRAKPWTH